MEQNNKMYLMMIQKQYLKKKNLRREGGEGKKKIKEHFAA